jgi:hypothetical protein
MIRADRSRVRIDANAARAAAAVLCYLQIVFDTKAVLRHQPQLENASGDDDE